MDRKVERANVKFCVKLGKSVMETLNVLQQAYGEEAMRCTQCFEWHRRSKGRRTSLKTTSNLEDLPQASHPQIVEQIRELVYADHQRMINDIADFAGVSYGSVQTIRIKHVVCCCQVCPSNADPRAEGTSGRSVPRSL
jgi:hypothetical protein